MDGHAVQVGGVIVDSGKFDWSCGKFSDFVEPDESYHGISYTKTYGNNAYIAPQATLTDGLLDVTILEPFTVLDVPSLAFQLFNKTIDQNSRIKTFRCRRLCIRRTAPGVVHFDGDPMETDADVNIELIQRGLRVVVPQAAEKDAANVLQRAQEYMNGIKLMNEAIVDNITDRNKKILKKLTKKG